MVALISFSIYPTMYFKALLAMQKNSMFHYILDYESAHLHNSLIEKKNICII